MFLFIGGGISVSSSKIRANYNQIILFILLHSAHYGDVFDLPHHKGQPLAGNDLRFGSGQIGEQVIEVDFVY